MKCERVGFIELYKYTESQLSIKRKINLGIVLKKDDYMVFYHDLLDKFKELEIDDDIVRSTYVSYLNKKYNCTLNFSNIKRLIEGRGKLD